MSRKIGRIAQDEVRIAVEQAVALEQQRIESVSADLIDTVGGGFDFPIGNPDPTTTTSGAVMPSLPSLPGFPGSPSEPGIPSEPTLNGF